MLLREWDMAAGAGRFEDLFCFRPLIFRKEDYSILELWHVRGIEKNETGETVIPSRRHTLLLFRELPTAVAELFRPAVAAGPLPGDQHAKPTEERGPGTGFGNAH
jgi:hypothetical protein